MYKILIANEFNDIESLVANSYDELKMMIDLAPEAKYEIVSVEQFDYELVEDFVEKTKKEIKPKGLVFGSGEPKIFREDCQEKEERK